MTDQPKSFTDISLKALGLSTDLRNIARHHPEAEWTDYPGDIACRTWTVIELIEHVTAIYTVLGFIAETPNGHINREALDGLWDQLKVPTEFLDSDWAKRALDEATSSFLTGGPDPQQQRERLQKAAPRMYDALAACFTMLGDYHDMATGNRARERIDEVREQAFKALAEATGEEPKLAD